MRDQGAPEALSLVIRVDVELVDEITRDGQKSRDTPVELRHPDIMADEHDVAEVLAIFLRRVALPRLEVRKGPEARAPREIVHRVEVRGVVSTNCGLAGHSGNLHRVRTGAGHDFYLSARLAHGHRIIGRAHGSMLWWEGAAMPRTRCVSAEAARAVPDRPAHERSRDGKSREDVHYHIQVHAPQSKHEEAHRACQKEIARPRERDARAGPAKRRRGSHLGREVVRVW